MAEKTGRAAESNGIAVMRSGGEYRLVSRRAIRSGSWLFAIDGVLTDVATRYSVQVGRGVHLDLPGRHGPDEITDHFYWRFTNHGCEPNALIRGREFFALKAIEPWQEITFNYNTTEYELAQPFDCRCGSDRCEGRIRGFRFLSPVAQDRLRPWLADHLLSFLEDDGPTLSTTAEGHCVVDR